MSESNVFFVSLLLQNRQKVCRSVRENIMKLFTFGEEETSMSNKAQRRGLAPTAADYLTLEMNA